MKKVDFNKGWVCRCLTREEPAYEVTLPHDAMLGEPRTEESTGEGNLGWYPGSDYEYTKSFQVPQEYAAKKLILEFEGVYRNAEVYINGKKAAFRPYGYTNFYVDMNSYLNYGEENRIRVVAYTLPNYIFFNTEKNEKIRNLIIDMMLELCEDRMYSQKVIHLMLGLFFTYLQRDYSHTVRFSSQSGRGIRFVPQIFAYMHENYQTTSVEKVAQYFHISHSYLSRIFKQHTRTTPVQMLQEIRLSHACEFLENTQLSIQEIAYKTGYSDVTFFIRIFHKKYGVTPLQYRKQHRIY